MRREFSAGGVLVRRLRGRWVTAAIRPGGKPEGVWALPKGLIGPGEDPASAIYIANKQKASAEVGMEPSNYPLPANTSREDLVALIERLNDDSSVDGILLQLQDAKYCGGSGPLGEVCP